MQSVFKLIIVTVPVIVFLFYFPYTKSKPASILTAFFLLIILTIFIVNIGKETYKNYRQTPIWDFQVFWLDGKVALTGRNFYDAKNYQAMSLPFNPGDDFKKEIIDVGFKYPPFTMFFFLPLGLFDISKAYILWQILNLLVCAGCIYGIWKLFLYDYGVLSLLLVAMLMLGLEPVRSTFSFSQTNFLVLSLFLLFWRNKSKGWSGIWLALCVVIKPYMALLYIYPLITRKWKMLAIAVLTLLAITFLSVLAFGPDVFVSFFNNPASKVPSYLYTEGVNQSLLATILRLFPNQLKKGPLFLNPLYLGISFILTLITAWAASMKKNSEEWVILSIIFLALIIYPASLEHYSVFLIIPVVLLFRQSSENVMGRIYIFSIILVTYFLSGYDSGYYMFFVNIFMWFICIILETRLSLVAFMHSIVTENQYLGELSLYKEL